MPRIVSVGTAVPPHSVSQEDIKQACLRMFNGHGDMIERWSAVFDHARVRTRHTAAPLAWYLTPRSFTERNDLYIQAATDLSAEAIRHCLEPAGLTPGDIDHLILVSTTGLATPSLDALLFNRLGIPGYARRTPIWGLGCAAGVAGLARAADYVRAYPESRVVLVAVELCTATFVREDFSKSNIVATALFGDGAAAALVAGDSHPGPAVVDAQSTLWPDSLDVMGWDIGSDGLKVVLSKALPAIVRSKLRPVVDAFLETHRITRSDVRHYIAHPGGPKVLDAYMGALELSEAHVRHARDILRDYGNMSSPTVLFVLKRFLEAQQDQNGDYGLIAAMGPGFSCELMLVRWE